MSLKDEREARRRFRAMQRRMSESQKRRHAMKKLLGPFYQMEAAA